MFSPTKVSTLIFTLFSITWILNSNSWFSMWLGLEINTICFTTFLFFPMNQQTTEACMLYFLPQALASSLFIISSMLLMNLSKFLSEHMVSSILISSMMLKLGAAPLHLWFIKITPSISWLSLFMLLTIQKLPPLYIISFFNPQPFFMNMFIFLSAIIGSLGGLAQTNLKSIMTYSSISHMSWMFTSFYINKEFWFLYLVIYTLLLCSITSLFDKKIFLINHLPKLNNQISLIYFLPLLFMSLGGLPPLAGFFPKWFIITNLNFIWLLIPLIISTLTNLFFYLRIVYSNLLIFKNLNILTFNHKSSHKKESLILLSLFLLPMVFTAFCFS